MFFHKSTWYILSLSLVAASDDIRFIPDHWFVKGEYRESVRPYDTFRDQCTSIVVGRSARAISDNQIEVGPLSSHSNDCADCDIQMAAVPSRKFNDNSVRGVNNDIPHLYPRRVEYGRAAIYEPKEGQPLKSYLGSIPQVSETYALFESSYPLMNEHGLAFGESTTEAKLILANAQVGHPDPRTNGTTNGTALFTISQLMQVALERCGTARCAMRTMADLSEKYGFAGESFGASEMVSVIDKKEAWIFEITGAGPFKGEGDLGSLWVAQRVPDDHVAVVANYMIIKQIDPSDEDNFMVSPHLFDRLADLGLYKGTVAEFNWQEVMGGELPNLEMYDLLRRWRIYSRIAPSLNMQPTHKFSDMPFSIKPDSLLTELDVMNLFRDHYEGTEFDMTQGIFAGPHGNPNYELTGRDMAHVKGGIPRAISLMRTAYTSIVTSDRFPKVWFGVDAPSSSVFVPFWVDSLRADGGNGTVSDRYTTGVQQKFDRYSAHWAFNFVSNYMGLNYQNMSMEYVYPKRDELQDMVIEKVRKAESSLVHSDDPIYVSNTLSQLQTEIQEEVVSSWWSLGDLLVMRYNDGYFNFPEWAPDRVKIVDIPVNYLMEMGFNDDFIRPTLHHFVPFYGKLEDAIAWGQQYGPITATTQFVNSSQSSIGGILVAIVACAVMFVSGSRFGARRERAMLKKGDYQRILA
jgi:dipeptidase